MANSLQHVQFSDLEKEFTDVNGRPIPREPLNFFGYKQGNRLFVNVVDSTDKWMDDIGVTERLFADMVVFPVHSSVDEHVTKLTLVQDILKQRIKYPGVKENPEWLKLARTWILPQKIRLGANPENLVSSRPDVLRSTLEPVCASLEVETIHVLKIDVSDGGERPLLYSFLDSGYRPGLLLVRWSHDIDEHVATAHCAGHVLNSGYSLVRLTDSFALYIFTDQTLYDICSMKTVSLQNPILNSILESVRPHVQSPTSSSTESTQAVQAEPSTAEGHTNSAA
jgi:hypothetical protein